jgi:hypothetical protein
VRPAHHATLARRTATVFWPIAQSPDGIDVLCDGRGSGVEVTGDSFDRHHFVRQLHLSGPLSESALNRRGASGYSLHSDVQGGPIDELLGVAVERPALDQIEVEVGRTLEDRILPGPTGDHREKRHLDAVDQTGGHKRPVQR